MAFDWREYLTLARVLIDAAELACSDEARRRVAISRSYYSGFGASHAFLEDRGEITHAQTDLDKGRIHGEVIQRFKNSGDGRRKKVGQYLGILRAARNRADYDAEAAPLTQDVEKALTEARWVHELLDKLSAR